MPPAVPAVDDHGTLMVWLVAVLLVTVLPLLVAVLRDSRNTRAKVLEELQVWHDRWANLPPWLADAAALEEVIVDARARLAALERQAAVLEQQAAILERQTALLERQAVAVLQHPPP